MTESWGKILPGVAAGAMLTIAAELIGLFVWATVREAKHHGHLEQPKERGGAAMKSKPISWMGHLY